MGDRFDKLRARGGVRGAATVECGLAGDVGPFLGKTCNHLVALWPLYATFWLHKNLKMQPFGCAFSNKRQPRAGATSGANGDWASRRRRGRMD